MPDDKQAAPATTPEELRQATVQGIDLFLNAGPIVRNYIGAEGLKMLAAQKAFWMQASPGELATYFTGYQNQS